MVIVAQLPVAIAKAFSPGHITGFFATEEQEEKHLEMDPKFHGSLGAGFSIDKGINTTVRVFKSSNKNYEIKINGVSSYEARVSKFVVEHYLRLIQEPLFISVEHDVEIPIGFGLGSSGAAALSLSYALNHALKTNLSNITAAQIAHHADLICKTGLGTVISEFTGGFEVRYNIGGPGIGKVLKIPVPHDLTAVILCLKPMHTNTLLNHHMSNEKRNILNSLGKSMISRFIKNQTIDTFLDNSHTFAKEYGLVDGMCGKPLQLMRSIGLKGSIALFGHTLFTLIKRSELTQAVTAFNQFNGQLLICKIDTTGARLVNLNIEN